MKNQCIKVLNEEHGKKVIEYFKSLGVDTICKGDCIGWHYGIFNGRFDFYDGPYDSEVIELPTKESEFKRGDKVLVCDNDRFDFRERILLTKIEGAVFPYICLMEGQESNFLRGNPFHTHAWKNCKHAPQTVELTLQDISDGKGFGVDPKLIKII